MTESDIESVCFSEDRIAEIVHRLAEKIRYDFKSIVSPQHPLVLVGILKGSYIFLSDLSRALKDVPHVVDFMTVSSYHGCSSTNNVKILSDLRQTIEGKHTIVVEDIVDTGLTLQSLLNILKTRNPASLRLCTLLQKPYQKVADVTVDYYGQHIGPEFVVGYGLDYNELFRNLPYIGILKKEAIERYK